MATNEEEIELSIQSELNAAYEARIAAGEAAAPDPVDAAVADLRATYQREVERINADGNLTLAGKTAAVQALADATNVKINALRDAFVKSAADERRRLERSILAAPKLPLGASASDKIARDVSFRDALDRAGRATEANPFDGVPLLELMRRALRSGDSILARGALTVAFERGNVDAINAYLAELPDGAAEAVDIDRLWTLMSTAKDTEGNTLTWRWVGV